MISRPQLVVTAVLSLGMLSISSLWTRATLAKAEASWHAADLAHSFGAAPEDIAGNMTWSCYHGAFDAWVRQVGGIMVAESYSGGHRMHFAFFDFLDQRFNHASFVLTSSVSHRPSEKSRVIATVPYRDEFLRARKIKVIKND